MRKHLYMLFVAVLLIVPLMIGGCAGIRENIIKLSEEDKANVEAVNTAAKNLMETWPTYSGAVNGWFIEDQSKMPLEFWNAVARMDKVVCRYYSAKYPPSIIETLQCSQVDEEPTDYELGFTLATRALLLKKTIMELLKRLAPEFLEVFPLALLGG